MLKDKYTTLALNEKEKTIVSTDTYALLEAKDMQLVALEKLRLEFAKHG